MIHSRANHHLVLFSGLTAEEIYVTPSWGDELERYYTLQFLPAWAFEARADQYGTVRGSFPRTAFLRPVIVGAPFSRGPERVPAFSPDVDADVWRVFELDAVNPRPIRQWVVRGPDTTPMVHPEPRAGWIPPAKWGKIAPLYWISPNRLTFPQDVADHRRPRWWPV